MQSVKAIVKIDLVSSKARYDLKPANRGQFIAELTTTAQNFFHNLSEAFPKGNFYSAQGDCIWVICDTPTIAVRNSIEFQKHWATKLKVFPDCRIVLDVGEIEDTIVAGKLELLGVPFENISVLEKEFGSGDVGLTEAAKDMVDKSLVHFKDFGEIQICSTRKIKAFKAEYKDPRSLKDTELFHAIFVAPTTSDEVRSKAVEAFFVSHLHHNPNEKLSLATVNNLLVTKGFSKIDLTYFKKLVQNSQFLEIEGDEKHCVLRANFANEIEKIATTFYNEKRKTIGILSSSLADSLDVPISTIQSWVGDLLEDYLSAVFLEIRMLASFYTSTQVLFEKLAISREFDYVIRNHVPKNISCSTERFSYFKSSFLRSLLKVISSSKRYFAAIFHSVLMLYYLNRTKYSTALIDKFADKQIYLDTSILYSYLCRASDFHEMVNFFVTQLQSLGVEICVFDKSIDEYHDSLNHAASVFKSGVRDPRTFLDGSSSWIRKEFNNPYEFG